jgi:hypothetical protein
LTATRVLHRKFRTYSGPLIYGKKQAPDFEVKSHCRRAVLLTEGVETGYRLGSIMAADGTAMTAGRGQHILVYPRELAHEDFNPLDDQGGLGALLRRLEVDAPSEALEVLWAAFRAKGWYVAQDGKLRWLDGGRTKVKSRWMEHAAGSVVHGALLRDTLTPLRGQVPKSGEKWEQAKRWAIWFHGVFSDPGSSETQLDFEEAHLIDRICHRKYRFRDSHRPETVAQVVYGITQESGDRMEDLSVSNLSFELDLAMCVFHSHTVNAPAIAYRKLREALSATGFVGKRGRGTAGEIALARDLLRRLAKTQYGRWNEELEHGRWNRTRARARESKMWPPEFFSSGRTRGSAPLMPERF